MLPLNTDLIHLAVCEHQLRLRRDIADARTGVGPIRRVVGRVLLWSGQRLTAESDLPAVAMPDVRESLIFPAPEVLPTRAHLDRAA